MTAPGAEPCGMASRDLGEEIAGTATVVTEWLLIEDRSVWGPDAVADLASRSHAMAALVDAAVGGGMRVMAIRRPSRRDRPPLVYRATSRDGAVRLTRDPLEVAAGTLTADPRAHLAQEQREMFLICTHGRRDPCCTRWGKPAAMDLGEDPSVWESSHVGGHRFAGNMVALPLGLYLGRMDRDNAGIVLEGLRAGRVPIEHLRGRSAWPQPAQAAEVFARRHLGDRGISGWRLVSSDAVAHGSWRSVIATPRGVVAVTVERVALPAAYDGCLKDLPSSRWEFRPVGFETLEGHPAG